MQVVRSKRCPKSDMNKKSVVRIICFGFFFLFVNLTRVLSQQTAPVFTDGDKVCFVGNSITNNSQFYNFVNLYYATRYPDRKVVFINCGISGDVTQGILNRMEKDILVHKPTWSVLMIGMNDVNRGLYAKSRENEAGIEEKKQAALDLYQKNMEIIVPKLLENGRKLILQKPTIYDQTGDLATENQFGVNDALKKCADMTQALADKYHLPVVDYWTILSEVNKSVQQKDRTKTIIGPDRVHPAAPGHLIMAYEFLKSTGAAEYVSKMLIKKDLNDSNAGSINCVIKDFSRKKESIQFSVKEGSLPFPVAPDAEPALSLVDFTDKFNKEILQIENIAAGNYQLLIDDVAVGTFPAKNLGEGINLALIKNTPQYQQAIKIMDLYSDYRQTQSKYRNIVTMEIHHLPDSLKTASHEIKETFFAKRLEEKYKTSPQYNYYKGQFASYLSNKLKQEEIEKALPRLIETVYQTNKPVFHTFKLLKTK